MTVVRSIVDRDTSELIDIANNIVTQCQGANCNTSEATFNNIFVQTNTRAQAQAQDLRLALNLQSTQSVRGNNITRGYIDLAANVAFSYRYICGADTTSNNTCVTTNNSVRQAQDYIVTQGEPAADAELRNFSVYVILTIVSMLALGLFLIFLVIGLFSRNRTSKKFTPPLQKPIPPEPRAEPRQLSAISSGPVVQPVDVNTPSSSY